MSLCNEIIKNLYGYSRAKYSTWFYYKPDGILFDAGEGVSIAMQNKIYAIEMIFLSHGHADHIAGLPGFLSSRASSMGDRNKPLVVYYPRGDRNVVKLRRYIEDSLGTLPFSMSWEEMSEGDRVPLAGKRSLEAFAAKHSSNALALGYKIVEHRTRLNAQYRDMPACDLMQIVKQQGREGISEKYTHNLLCFSGDSMPLDIPVIENAEVLLHDATFLKADEREEATHATLDEVFDVANQAKVSLLGLFHFSTRYRHGEIIRAIRSNIERVHANFPVFYLLPHTVPFTFKKISDDNSAKPDITIKSESESEEEQTV